jgi:glycosyltransferase involved in cell wall biosynthesis
MYSLRTKYHEKSNKKKPKILLLTEACTVGGVEMHLLSLAKYLNKAKYDLTLAFFVEKPDDARSLKSDFLKCGVKIVDLKGGNKFSIAALLRLIKLIRTEQFDIIHTHLYRADLIGALASKICRTPILISSVHNTDARLQKRLIALLIRTANRAAVQTIVISDAVGRYLIDTVKLDPNKIKRIYYGLEVKGYSTVKQDIRKEYRIYDAPLVGMVGRYAPVKGHQYLLEAMKKVIEKISRAKLFLAGHDQQNTKAKLEQLAEKLGISENVIFAGFSSNVLDLDSQFDVFALSSLWEGFGLVLLEAMSVGTPVVATRVGAVPEIVVDGKTGFLVPPGDPEAMAEKLILLLENKTLAKEIGEAGRKRWQALFSMDRMIKATEEVYDYWLSRKR